MTLDTVITAVAGGALTLLVSAVAYLGKETRADVRDLKHGQREHAVMLAKITTHLGIED